MPGQAKKSIWTLSFTLLVLITFCTSMFSIGLNNGITLYGDSVGMSATESGLLVSVFMVTASVIRLLTGEITDRYSPKKVFLLGASVTCIGCFMPFASFTYPILVLSRVVQGLGFSFATTASAVMLAEAVPHDRIGEGMAFRGLGTALATALGPSMAVLLVGFGDASMVFFGFGCILALSLGMGSACKIPLRTACPVEEAGRGEARVIERESASDAAAGGRCQKESFSRRLLGRWIEVDLLPIMIVEFFRRIVTGACTSFMVIYGMHAGIAHPSIFFVVSSVAIISFRLWGSRLLDTAYPVRLLCCAFAVGGAGFSLLLFVPCALTYYLAGVFFGVVEGLGSPCLNAMTFKNCPEGRWGTASANFHLTGDAGVAAGAFICGWCIDVAGNSTVPLVPVAALAVGIVLVAALFPKAYGRQR